MIAFVLHISHIYYLRAMHHIRAIGLKLMWQKSRNNKYYQIILDYLTNNFKMRIFSNKNEKSILFNF